CAALDGTHPAEAFPQVDDLEGGRHCGFGHRGQLSSDREPRRPRQFHDPAVRNCPFMVFSSGRRPAGRNRRTTMMSSPMAMACTAGPAFELLPKAGMSWVNCGNATSTITAPATGPELLAVPRTRTP